MAASSNLLLVLLLAFSCCVLEPSLVSAQDQPTVYQRIYRAVEGIRPCFRLTNATSQIGCSASPSNVSGLVLHVTHQQNISAIVDGAVPYGPFIVLLETNLFNKDNILLMRNSPHVNGIVIEYEDNTLPSGNSSPASQCPNDNYGNGDQSCPWNSFGNDLSHTDFGNFPVFAIPKDLNNSFGVIGDCYRDYNTILTGGLGDYPLCAAEMQADMKSVLSTPECYRRAAVVTNLGVAECDPLSDQNVWSTLFELDRTKDIIVVATKLDSTAFFPGLSYGAVNDMSGIAVQMAVAEALGGMKTRGELTGLGKQIMFAFFQGESWDYIGSSRMVYDMNKGVFPYEKDDSKMQPPLVNYTNVTDFLQLSQLTTSSSDNTFYIHQNQNHKSALYDALMNSAAAGNVSLLKGEGIPPVSFQRFLRVNGNLPGVVLTGYNDTFVNRFYGSHYDNLANLIGEDGVADADNPAVQRLVEVANAIVKALLNVSQPQYAGSNPPPVPTVRDTTIANIIGCFLQSTNCSLLKTVLGPPLASGLSNGPLSRYVSVANNPNPVTVFTFQLMSYFTGTANKTSTCDECLQSFNQSIQTFNTTWMHGPNNNDSSKCWCVQSFTHYHKAESPAFELGDHSSTEYSTWAESRWTAVGMRVYLVTTPVEEGVVFVFGVLILLITFFISCQCQRKGQLIFAASAVTSIRNHDN